MISFSIWQYKELTFDQYRKILVHLDSFYDINLVVTASPDERSQAQELINHSSTWALNRAGRTTTIEMVCQLSLAAMVISIDNLAIHISLAVKMPTVNIFGPTSANNWAPGGISIIPLLTPCPAYHVEVKDAMAAEKPAASLSLHRNPFVTQWTPIPADFRDCKPEKTKKDFRDKPYK
ncbi:glycosyltransferase family 9 protein [uncultured Desulfosarcina sp.]|uniref:glycosyltransferase family 9 protein n=1 Tax=uncultured Desulfosarcina sp. TaxID=218289 RepID=UPI0029C6CAD6|nr:glycosyltransferase family 9 protein [uncultured Desulfosarcina sp.]